MHSYARVEKQMYTNFVIYQGVSVSLVLSWDPKTVQKIGWEEPQKNNPCKLHL